MTDKYRVVVEVLSLKTLDVEVSASNPKDAKEAVQSALLDYGTSAESLMMIQTDESRLGFRFQMDVVSREVNVKEATLAQSERDIEFETWYLKEKGLA
jgi:hypothetical protein